MQAINGGWVTDQIGLRAAKEMYDVLLDAKATTRDKLAAVAALARLASVDVSRERNDTTERGQDVSAATDLLRSLAKDHPELYGQLCKAIAERQRTQLPAPPTDAPNG